MLCNFARVSCGKLRKRKLRLQSEGMLQTITRLQPKAAQVHQFVLSYQLSDLPLIGWPISPATLEHCRTIKILQCCTATQATESINCQDVAFIESPYHHGFPSCFGMEFPQQPLVFFRRTTDSQPLTTKIHHLR